MHFICQRIAVLAVFYMGASCHGSQSCLPQQRQYVGEFILLNFDRHLNAWFSAN